MTLDAAQWALIEAAREAQARAYAPYSGYQVGAAIRATDGRVFTGVNVENSAYPSCVCAEVNAVGTAVAAGVRSFAEIAIATTPKAGSPPGAPCGQCRQVLSELAPDLVVLLAGPEGAPIVTSIRDLLPHAFTPDDL
jgi:cytidine deaminase